MRKVLLTIWMGLTALIAAAQADIKVNVPKVVTLDEQFTLSFIVEGARPSTFEWEQSADFEILYGPIQGRRSNVQIINGKRSESSQTTYTYCLYPRETGKFMIPAATAVVNGKQVSSPQMEIEVLAGNSRNTASAQNQISDSAEITVADENQGPDVLLFLNVNKRDVVVGEPIKASVKLYTKVEMAGLERILFPVFDGFWTQVTAEPDYLEFEREVLNGEVYNSALMREYVLIPQNSGTIEIGAAEVVFLQNEAILRNGFFPDYQVVRRTVESDPVNINVMSLPSPAPASFAGGVGTFSVSASLSNEELATHEAAHLVLKVSGRGNIQLLETPKIDFPLEMEAYDPTVTSNVAADGVAGTRTYEYPFIPRSPGEFEVGPIDYTYYDVDAHEYATVTIPAISVSVVEGEDVGTGTVPSSGPIYRRKSGVQTLSSDIRHISNVSSEFKQKGDFFVGSMLFWGLILLLLAVSGVVFVVYRKVSARNADVVGMKHRKATKMALKRLRKAGTLLKTEQSAEFYQELHRSLLGYASDKLNMPMSELAKERISEVLLANGASEDSVGQFMDLLDSCEFARYAPSTANQSMVTDYEKAIDVISSIDASMKTGKRLKSKVLTTLVLLFVSVGAYAADASDVDELWNSANESYSNQQFSDAVRDYEAIAAAGLESPELYYNTGNAYYQQGNYAKAALFYERALKLDPSYSDAEYNRDFVNGLLEDKIEPVPEFFLKEWLREVSYMTDSDGWAIVFMALLAVTLCLTLVFFLASSVVWKRIGFFTGIVTMVLMFGALAFSIWQKSEYEDSDKAIVMRTVSVKSTPSDSSGNPLFILHPGTKVEVLEILGANTRISIADGRQGWVNTSDIESI